MKYHPDISYAKYYFCLSRGPVVKKKKNKKNMFSEMAKNELKSAKCALLWFFCS